MKKVNKDDIFIGIYYIFLIIILIAIDFNLVSLAYARIAFIFVVSTLIGQIVLSSKKRNK